MFSLTPLFSPSLSPPALSPSVPFSAFSPSSLSPLPRPLPSLSHYIQTEKSGMEEVCQGKDESMAVKEQEIAVKDQIIADSRDMLAVKDAHIAALCTELRGKDRMLQAKTRV